MASVLPFRCAGVGLTVDMSALIVPVLEGSAVIVGSAINVGSAVTVSFAVHLPW